MRQKSTFFSITLFALVLTASVHSQPRLDDATNSNLDGSTITITPSSTYKVYCYTPDFEKNWYKINGDSASSITKDPQPVPDHGYAKRSASGTLGLHFEPFRTNDIGEYQCGYTTFRQHTSLYQSSVFTTLTIYLTTPPTPTPTPTPAPTPTPTPMPLSKVQGVTVSKTGQDSSPALRVSWSAVNGSGITYTVCYSTTCGTQSDPPSGANCGSSGITGTSTTLGSLSIGTTYYIWVAAVSSGRRGPYSDRRQERTFQVTDIKTNGLADSNAFCGGLSAGLFVAGLFSGVIALLLVEGIICGVCKISKMSKKKNTKETYTEPTNMQMTECPAYETTDKEGKTAERLYEDIES